MPLGGGGGSPGGPHVHVALDLGHDVLRALDRHREPPEVRDLDLLLDVWDVGKVSDQPRLERAFRLEFQDDRVHLGIAEQRALRDEAWAHVEHQRWDEALAGLDLIELHDPMLPLWRHEVERLREALEEEQRSEEFLRELEESLEAPPDDGLSAD